ncbi:MAG: prephenate dehydratase [Clostridia bacterium]|nr:prephenate dehydratase [Clostridia bacterium]NCC43107.1 prephenate dehydratase [Clostridia bacterium]
MLDLLEIRKEIDTIDEQIVRLFEERMQLCSDVATFKIENGKEVLDRKRENEKLEALCAKASNPFNQVGVQELFRQIMAMSRKLQYRVLTENGKDEKFTFKSVRSLPLAKAKVVFQGVEGAYSFTAMHSFFGEAIESFNVETWRDAMEAIRSGEADYAVLPIENSTAGIVADIYDLLVEYHHSIVGEQIIHVDHALMGLKNSSLEDIKTVYSHPQALAQCQKFLDGHPEWKSEEFLNTAMAAKKIKDDGDMSQAAIASPYAAQCFGLQILKPHIFSSAQNSTRFIIVSRKEMYVEGAGKISVCFEIPHESGSLYDILSHFIYNDLNMTKIESRPIPEKNWEYRFFVDFEGNLNDSGVKNALFGIREEASNLRILGNY